MCPFLPAPVFPCFFALICPDQGQIQNLSQYQCSTLEFFDKHDETWLWNTLAKRTFDVPLFATFQPRAGRRCPSPLERLPTEIIEEILDIILHDSACQPIALETVLALGLSSAHLWSRILYRMHRDSRHDYYHDLPISWAGKRIGFHSTVSPFSEASLRHYHIDNALPAEYEAGKCMLQTVSYQPRCKWLDNVRTIRCSHPTQWHYGNQNHKLHVKIKQDCLENEWDQIEQDLSPLYLYPQDRVWVLRNLTTRQFIRSDQLNPPEDILRDLEVKTARVRHAFKVKRIWKAMKTRRKPIALSEKKPYDENRDMMPFTLGQVLLMLTCASELEDIPAGTQDPMFQRGPWSDHAFDLVTFDEHNTSDEIRTITRPFSAERGFHDTEADSMLWEDVSKAAIAELTNVRKYIFLYWEDADVDVNLQDLISRMPRLGLTSA